MLTLPHFLTGGVVIPFDVTSDLNANARLPETLAGRLDVVVAAGAIELGGSVVVLVIEGPVDLTTPTLSPVSAEAQRPFLERELLVPPKFRLGADVVGAPFGFQIRLQGWLLRIALTL